MYFVNLLEHCLDYSTCNDRVVCQRWDQMIWINGSKYLCLEGLQRTQELLYKHHLQEIFDQIVVVF